MRFYQTIIFFLLGVLHLCHAQTEKPLPVLKPSYINHFDQEDASYASKCFKNAVLDEKGRLWLSVCRVHATINSIIGLLQFDGYRFIPFDMTKSDKSLTGITQLFGTDRSGKLFGAIGFTNHLFFTDPESLETQFIPFSPFKSRLTNIVETEPGRFLLLTRHQTSIGIMSLQNGHIEEEVKFSWNNRSMGPEWPLLETPQEIWFVGWTLPVFRYNKATQSHVEYDAGHFTGKITEEKRPDIILNLPPSMVNNEAGELYLYLPRALGDQFYHFARREDRFVTIMDQFPATWKAEGLYQDQAGNICFLFQDAAGIYKAILEDKRGNRFDYSSIVEKQVEIRKLIGRNFFQQVFVLDGNGLTSISVWQSESTRKVLTGEWISSMIQLPNGKILVSIMLEGWYMLDPETGTATPFKGPDCGVDAPVFEQNNRQQIQQDENGNLWFASEPYLVCYNPSDGSCTAFDLGKKYHLFTFVDKDLVVLTDMGNRLAFYNISSRTFHSYGTGIPTKLPAKIRDFLVDAQGMLWIPTNQGFWKLDLKEEKSEVFGLDDAFGDVRFTSIYEAPDGKIWLGTYFNGLVIFDPDTGEIQIINQQQGLSNNSVMSIIADNEHMVWVTTEYGITLLSPEGRVLAELHKEDGLSYEVFERYDSYKDKEGRLYFGSRNGITIIQPDKFKANLKRNAEVNIYLTELAYYDSKQRKDRVHRDHLGQPERLILPADHRYLRLKFALSSYIEPQNNRYAYKLEGIDKDWKLLGNQHELTMNYLPAGKYNLLIKGADYNNNWTADPLVIPIHAHEFFYKQSWFYALVFGLASLIAFFWIRRLRSEKRRLEMEVKRRTQQILEDKELIEKQADDLRQLDELKSRFFTNISHELRTPIALITAPAEQMLQELPQTLGKSLRNKLQLMLRNGRNLLRLVEELLDLSRLEANKMQLQEEPTQLAVYFRGLFSAFESRAALRSIDYQIQCDLPDEACYLIDRKRLEKIVNNLLSNALKFTSNGGEVIMRVKSDGNLPTTNDQPPMTNHQSATSHQLTSTPLNQHSHLIIQVQDTGRGIPPEDLPHVFERYFQTKREGVALEGGLGIGLALSAELARLMNGKLTVESQLGQGSTFTLAIPAKLAPSQQPAIVTEPPLIVPVAEEVTTEAPVASKGERPRLLLVEDNPDMQKLLQSLLSETYDCRIANNGAEAWNWISEGQLKPSEVDMIVSDIMMPEMDGYELLERIKKHPEWQQLPMIMLTARADEEDKLQALRLGVDDYLLKPFSPAELLARTKNLIANYRQRQAIPQEEKSKMVVEFEATESAEQEWLRELEEATKQALKQQIDLTSEYLAGQMALSERQLRRRLKALTGLTLTAYSQTVKLQKARHLLESKTFLTIAEVAHACGLTPSYFTQLYRKQYGKNPADYFV